VCVFFADIVDSARLYASFGDDGARRIVVTCLTTLSSVIERFGGTVVDRIGDEVLCTFPMAESAAFAAIEINKTLERQRQAGALPAGLGVRIGFHYGSVVVEDNRIFGETVYTAKRVSALAKAHQIFTTVETINKQGSSLRNLCRIVGDSTIKGKRGVFEILEIIWDDSLQTIVCLKRERTRSADSKLYLAYQDGQATLDASNPVFTIGREGICNWVVSNPGVSRLHARVVYQNGKFLLIDVSRNGTLIIQKDGTEVHVHRDEYPLSGAGAIRPIGSGVPLDSHILEYQCYPEA